MSENDCSLYLDLPRMETRTSSHRAGCLRHLRVSRKQSFPLGFTFPRGCAFWDGYLIHSSSSILVFATTNESKLGPGFALDAFGLVLCANIWRPGNAILGFGYIRISGYCRTRGIQACALDPCDQACNSLAISLST